MKDIRGLAKAERQYARQDRVRCAVCGRHLLTRNKKGWCCSKRCAEKLKEGQDADQ
jgi:hypothetical protein